MCLLWQKALAIQDNASSDEVWDLSQYNGNTTGKHMSLLSFKGVTKRYGSETALSDVTFSVPDGSVCALLGQNGAGKTTLLEILLGIREPSSGSAYFNTVDSRRLGKSEFSQIAFVSESVSIDSNLRVRDIINLAREVYSGWNRRVEADLVGRLDLALERRFGELSRGTRIRVQFLLALSCGARLLVMDEPFSGLDPIMRDSLIESVANAVQEGNSTAIISSHDLDDVAKIASHVAILDRGALVIFEEKNALLKRHRKLRVLRNIRDSCTHSLPESWLELAGADGVAEFVDSDYGSGLGACELFGSESVLDESAMTLGEICRTHLRARRNSGGEHE
jgi:ABC-2 type transport system ATP-binding protein